jgi:hypothetical protein
MAENIYLVYRAESSGESFINGITSVVINADDGGTAADTIADAIAQCVAAGHPLPSNYFDTVVDLNTTTGALADDTDCYIFKGREVPEKVEA